MQENGGQFFNKIMGLEKMQKEYMPLLFGKNIN